MGTTTTTTTTATCEKQQKNIFIDLMKYNIVGQSWNNSFQMSETKKHYNHCAC